MRKSIQPVSHGDLLTSMSISTSVTKPSWRPVIWCTRKLLTPPEPALLHKLILTTKQAYTGRYSPKLDTFSNYGVAVNLPQLGSTHGVKALMDYLCHMQQKFKRDFRPWCRAGIYEGKGRKGDWTGRILDYSAGLSKFQVGRWGFLSQSQLLKGVLLTRMDLH